MRELAHANLRERRTDARNERGLVRSIKVPHPLLHPRADIIAHVRNSAGGSLLSHSYRSITQNSRAARSVPLCVISKPHSWNRLVTNLCFTNALSGGRVAFVTRYMATG